MQMYQLMTEIAFQHEHEGVGSHLSKGGTAAVEGHGDKGDSDDTSPSAWGWLRAYVLRRYGLQHPSSSSQAAGFGPENWLEWVQHTRDTYVAATTGTSLAVSHSAGIPEPSAAAAAMAAVMGQRTTVLAAAGGVDVAGVTAEQGALLALAAWKNLLKYSYSGESVTPPSILAQMFLYCNYEFVFVKCI